MKLSRIVKLTTGLACLVSVVSYGALSWDAPSVNLGTFDIDEGWLVLMYQDVDGDSDLSTIIFDDSGAPAGGTGYSDDIFMGASFQTTTVDSRGDITFGTTIAPGWEDTYGGASVYTVVIDASSWASATESRIFDGNTHTLGVSDPHTYAVPVPANDWQTVIPEPSTMALLGLGAFALAFRRRFVKV